MNTELGFLVGAAALAALCGAWAVVSALQTYAGRWQAGFASEVEASLRRSYWFVDGAKLFRVYRLGLGGVALGVLIVTHQPLLVLILLGGLGAVPGLVLRGLDSRRRRVLTEQLPDVVMLLAGALRSGASLAQALGHAAHETPAPLGRELALLTREQRLGVTLDQSLQGLEQRLKLEALTLIVAAIRIAQETGGNLAETLERLGDSLRRKAVLEGKIDALTAQGRLQGWVMACLPIVVAGALCVIEPQAMRPLYSTWQGGALCAVLVLFEGLGFYFIRRIVAIDV